MSLVKKAREYARLHVRHVAAIGMLAVIMITSLTVALFSINGYTVVDGGKTIAVRSVKASDSEILAAANISLGQHDVVVRSGKQLTVMRAFPVTVKAGGNSQEIFTTQTTVENILSLANVTMDDDDIINIDPSQILSASAVVEVTHISYTYHTQQKAVAYTVKTIYTDDMDAGETKTRTAGSEGLVEVKYLNKLANGAVIETETVEEVVVKAPVQSEKLVGTRAVKAAVSSKAASSAASSAANQPATAVTNSKAVKTSADVKQTSTLTPAKPIELDANGRPVSYSKLITGKASAYYSPGVKTKSGKAPIVGYVAVNPKQIPLGSKLYIITPDGKRVYGYAVAEDTGGFTKLGRVIDLYMNSEAECVAWGVRNVEIYVLK